MVGSNVAEAPSDKDKTISHTSGMTAKRCLRMHVMYKTPAQVLREMDQERDRMTLMAELTDMIEKKTAKLKAEQKKKRLKAKKAKKQQPSWYQELTTAQVRQVHSNKNYIQLVTDYINFAS
ncbi:hypothetical protein R5R35_001643 [Gryllus longicercus]|uniref:Uncharacterized protein n=1 Tax=Gryllus longicercus TaxID=2509291 RepID=A0AAN9VP05_9ORTH